LILWNHTLEYWNPVSTINVGNGPRSVQVGDVNNDGYNDIVTSDQYDNAVTILLWNDNTNDWDSASPKAVREGPYSVFIGDVNNDGYNDIVTSNSVAVLPVSYEISVLLWNNTAGDWDSVIWRAVGDSPWSVFIGDADNDGDNDIATANYDDNTVSIICWNESSSDWDSVKTKAVGVHPYSVFIEDADNDGLIDVVTANWGPPSTVSIILSYLDPPLLDSISPDPNTNGRIRLNWGDVGNASIYYIYRDNSSILSVNTSTPIHATTQSMHTDTVYVDGQYFYVVVAGDGSRNSSISNCVNVNVEISQEAIPSFNIIALLGGIVIITSVIIIRWRRSKK